MGSESTRPLQRIHYGTTAVVRRCIERAGSYAADQGRAWGLGCRIRRRAYEHLLMWDGRCAGIVNRPVAKRTLSRVSVSFSH